MTTKKWPEHILTFCVCMIVVYASFVSRQRGSRGKTATTHSIQAQQTPGPTQQLAHGLNAVATSEQAKALSDLDTIRKHYGWTWHQAYIWSTGMQKILRNQPPLSAEEESLCKQFVREILDAVINGHLGRRKSDWDRMSTEDQIQMCEVLEDAMQWAGCSKDEAAGFSLFVGPFMQTAPPQATIEDAVSVYGRSIKAERTRATLMAFREVLDTTLKSAQILESVQRMRTQPGSLQHSPNGQQSIWGQ